MPQPTPAIILSTLNAKYIHASLGLRYLLANKARHGGDELCARTLLRKFTIARPTAEIVATLLAELGEAPDDGPQIVGFGVYGNRWKTRMTKKITARQLFGGRGR